MSLLAILVPARSRSAHQAESSFKPSIKPSAGSAAQAAPEWRFVYSRDGQGIDREGTAPAERMPRADRTVLVVQDEDVSWLQATLPRSAARRLQAALVGALEDQLLEEAQSTHLAVSRDGLREDGPTWVAALHKPWVEQVLATLTGQGLLADALVGLSEPTPSRTAHAKLTPDGQAVAVVCGPQGVALGPLAWAGWRTRLSDLSPWTAEPEAAQACADLGLSDARVRLIGAGERALTAAASGSNLLQFDLAPRMRGSRAAVAAWSTFKDRRFRVIRVGLVALALIQIVGLNVSAWQADREIRQLQALTEAQLRESFPSIKVVVDPVAQAERELQSLRRIVGVPGPAELETWLDVASTAWTGQAAPIKALRLNAQGLSMDAPRWPAPSLEPIADHARRQGWQTRLDGSVLLVQPPAEVKP